MFLLNKLKVKNIVNPVCLLQPGTVYINC